jgi:hypothetical protein
MTVTALRRTAGWLSVVRRCDCWLPWLHLRLRWLLHLARLLAGRWSARVAHHLPGLRDLPLRRPVAGADAGMTTAEYAVGTVAACGFAAVLYKVVTSDAVSSAITGLIQRALDAGF